MPKRKLSNTEKLQLALSLLEELSEHPKGIDLQSFSLQNGIDSESVSELVQLISNLSNRRTGERTVIEEEGNTLRLVSESGKLKPLRLRIDEGFVLASLLEGSNIDAFQKTHIESALLPPEICEFASAAPLHSNEETRLFSQLKEAIDYGIRISIDYRSQSDADSRIRRVDPLRLEYIQGVAYLFAWDTHVNAERSYRLDRIYSIAFTDESVEAHTPETNNMHASLAAHGTRVQLTASADYLPQLSWAGIDTVSTDEAAQSVQVETYVSSPVWLYEKVLSSGGNLRITAPRKYIEGLVSYANSLIAEGA